MKTFVKRTFHNCQGRNIFISQKGNVTNKFKYIQIEKFAPKILVQQAICYCGLKSAIYITRKTLSSDLYLEECLKKGLLPFITKHDMPAIFWPFLAIIHFSK